MIWYTMLWDLNKHTPTSVYRRVQNYFKVKHYKKPTTTTPHPLQKKEKENPNKQTNKTKQKQHPPQKKNPKKKTPINFSS